MKSKKRDFQEVQKALRLKRHEQPPPRFFRSFTDEVIDRINSPQPAQARPWCERLGFGEDYRLFLLCVVGVVVCAALALGWAVAIKVPPPARTLGGPQTDPSTAAFTTPGDAVDTVPAGYQPLIGTDGPADSTTPVMAPGSNTAGLGPLPVTPQGNRP